MTELCWGEESVLGNEVQAAGGVSNRMEPESKLFYSQIHYSGPDSRPAGVLMNFL